MEATEMGRNAGAGTQPKEPARLKELNGRIDIIAGEQLAATMEVAGGRARVVDGDGGGGEGETRATIFCRSLDELQRMTRREVKWIPAAFRGELGIRGDLAFAIKVLQTMGSTLPVDWALAPAKPQTNPQTNADE